MSTFNPTLENLLELATRATLVDPEWMLRALVAERFTVMNCAFIGPEMRGVFVFHFFGGAIRFVQEAIIGVLQGFPQVAADDVGYEFRMDEGMLAIDVGFTGLNSTFFISIS